jgi:hypothetical protein
MWIKILLGSVLLFFGTLISGWYYDCYQQRKEIHRQHLFVLQTECIAGKLHPSIQHNLMTYEGLQTNCTEAHVYTQTPIWLGACDDCWRSSIWHTLIHADDWRVQLTYMVGGVLVAVMLARELFRQKRTKAALKALATNKQSIQIPKRILVADIPPNKVGEETAKALFDPFRPMFVSPSTATTVGGGENPGE